MSDIKKRIKTFFLMLIMVFATIIGTVGEVHAAKDNSTAIAIGIDVSKYQGVIDWNQVAASGVTFAFIRVGHGTYMDPYFDINMRGAAAAGIRTGVYFYTEATTPEQAVVDATIVLNAIAPYCVSMPVVYDVEDEVHRRLNPQQLADVCNMFCAVIESAGYYPMVYSSKSWFERTIGPLYFDKWVAQWSNACAIDDASFWQASCTGRIAGISVDVDIDYQFKDYSQLIIANGFLARKGYLYYYENYHMQTNRWVIAGEDQYYVDELGHVITGTFYPIGDSIYCFDATGRMLKGWQELGGMRFYFGTDGKMATGFTTIGNQCFLFDVNGCMVQGWFNDGEHIYHFDELDGHMASGIEQIGVDRFFFDQFGWQHVGWINDGVNDYYFNPAGGAMMCGWFTDGTGEFYADIVTGAKQTGFVTIGNAVYYLGTDGRKQLGLQIINGGSYYFDPVTGMMLTGLQAIGNDLYYFDPATGVMMTGLITAADGTRYFDPATGRMLTGIQNIGGANYFFGVNGLLISGLVTDGVYQYYFDPATGAQLFGFVGIGDGIYYFEPALNGAMLVNTVIDAGGVYWQIGADGRVVM